MIISIFHKYPILVRYLFERLLLAITRIPNDGDAMKIAAFDLTSSMIRRSLIENSLSWFRNLNG